jgi:hypothetical protein
MTQEMYNRLAKLSDGELASNLTLTPDDWSLEALEMMRQILSERGHSENRIEQLTQAESMEHRESSEERLKGIGGWLMVFLVFTVIGIVQGFFGLITMLESGDFLAIIIQLAIVGAQIGLVVLCGSLHPLFPRIAIVTLAVIGALGVLSYLIEGVVVMAFLSAIGPAIWIAYLSSSMRVKNTFGIKKEEASK